jgi:phosphomannomutase
MKVEQIKFGTDGWRAIIAKEFTVRNVARLTEGLVGWIEKEAQPKRIVIGYDCRFAGRLFAETVARVLVEKGVEVILSDRMVTTPMLALAARDMKTAAGVMITASHNPSLYNGYKLKTSAGGPMGGQDLKTIESLIPYENTLPYDPTSFDFKSHVKFKELDLEGPYVKAIEAAFDMELLRSEAHNYAYDAMYGSGQFVMKRLFPSMMHFRCTVDPTFQGISPEPIARNLDAFNEYLVHHGNIQCGLVTDGDADRIGLMDGMGNFIDSHHIMLLIVHYLVHYKGKKGKVVTAFSTVTKLKDLCLHYDLPLEVVKIGFKYASEVMMKEPILFAGEESGGMAVEGHIPERDGIWMALLIMEFMAKTGKGINELIQEVYDLVGPFVFKRNDLHLSMEKKLAVVERCEKGGLKAFGSYEVRSLETLDGFKFILSDDSWIMIRPSGTEPVLRVYVQAPSESDAQGILKAGLAEIAM